MQTNTPHLETLYPIRTSTLSIHPGLFEAENNVNRLFGSLVNSHNRPVARVSFLNAVGLTLPWWSALAPRFPHVWRFSACQDMVKESTVERTGVSRTRPDPVLQGPLDPLRLVRDSSPVPSQRMIVPER